MNYSNEFYRLAQELIAAGRFIDQKGWVPATSGNFSARLLDGTIALTVSGKHKGQLNPEDLMLVDINAHALDGKKPSAEVLLHTRLYQRFPGVNAVLHPHSMSATLVSKLFTQALILEDYELLKALPTITTHASRVIIPIFENDQDISRLSACVDQYFDQHADVCAYIIVGHGFYTWGGSVQETLQFVEALDFLFECELRLYRVKN